MKFRILKWTCSRFLSLTPHIDRFHLRTRNKEIDWCFDNLSRRDDQRQIKCYFSVDCYDKMSESHHQIREENNLLLDSDDLHSGCRKSPLVTPTIYCSSKSSPGNLYLFLFCILETVHLKFSDSYFHRSEIGKSPPLLWLPQ